MTWHVHYQRVGYLQQDKLCRQDDVKHFMRFILQPKSATEIGQ